MQALPRPIPTYLQEMVDRELRPDERIRWIDLPIPYRITPKWQFIVLLATPVTVFPALLIAFFAWRALHSSKPVGAWLGAAMMTPIFLVGFAYMLGPFWLHRMCKPVYVITNRRAISIGARKTLKFEIVPFWNHSLPAGEFGHLMIWEKQAGSGDIVIPPRTAGGDAEDPESENVFFPRLRDFRMVEKMLHELAAEAGNPISSKAGEGPPA